MPDPHAPESLSLFDRFYRWANNVLMTRFVPLDRPGPLLGWLFKLGARTYRYGFGQLTGDRILLLTTTGRKSGLPRETALEYGYLPALGGYVIMAGWKGRTDWARNLRADPRVRVQAGRREFRATAQRLPDETVADMLYDTFQRNPGARQVFARWVGHALDGSWESALDAARVTPSFLLCPQDD